MSGWFDHEFTAPLEVHRLGALRYRVVFLPPALHAALGEAAGPVRCDAEVADLPVRGAWQRAPGGRRYLMLSRATCRAAGLRLGAPVEVRFRVVAPDDVQVPDELAQLLARDRAARRAWDQLTAGRRRGCAHWVESAKRPATRERRLADVRLALRGEPSPLDRMLGRA